MEKLTLSAPWITFVHELQVLFKDDPDVDVIYDENGEYVVKLFVDSPQKADALSKLLPVEKEFGNVVLKIMVIPANTEAESYVSLFEQAFKGNPILREIQSVNSTLGTFNYAIFKSEVVQFYNDRLDDPHGNISTLYQEIVKDVFGPKDGVFYCTEFIDD